MSSDGDTLQASSSSTYSAYIPRSSRGMHQSESMNSIATSPIERSPSPYIPERDSTRDELMGVLLAFRACDPADLTSKLHLGSQTHRLLIEGSDSSHIKDDFREAGGFLVIVQMLSSLDQNAGKSMKEDFQIQNEDANEKLRVGIYELALTILGEALHRHTKNRAAFQRIIGWSSFSSVLKLSTIFETSPEQFFAALFGLAIGSIAPNLGRLSLTSLPEVETSTGETQEEGEVHNAFRIAEQWNGTVEHSGVLVTVVQLLGEHDVPSSLHLRILAVLYRLASLSNRNQNRMANTEISTMLLEMDITPSLQSTRIKILERLYQHGMPTRDCRLILRRVDEHITSSYLPLLQRVAGPSMSPNLITFDMSRYGHCSIAISSLPRPFPPGTASKGFSFFASILIERIEPSMGLDLLHLFDSHRVCSVRLSVEPGTGQINYSTSADSPTIHFHKARLTTGKLHHISLTHARPSGGSKLSLVQLFIDGILVQQEKAAWPATPPSSSTMRAVFGTPPLDRLSKSVNRLVWSLGPAYLFEDVLPQEVPMVISELASTGYCGNFQDSLGRFLTYSISTRINLRLETLAQANGANEKQLAHTPLVQVITAAARNIFNEDRFYFILNSANHYDVDKIAKKAYSTHGTSVDRMQKPGKQLLLNQAVTLTKDAIDTSYGFAKMFGSPILAPSQSLADTIWKLGGCAILLRLVDLSNTPIALKQSLTLLFDLLKGSWRLSEDAERSKSYETLDHLLGLKKHLITEEVLEIICSAVGYTYSKGNEAALVNPFLYRILILDFNIWSQTSAQIQLAHLNQFLVLLKTSKHRKFNAKRVAKMQITKKLLQSLQLCDIHGTLDETKEFRNKFVSCLRISLISSFNDASIRSVSTYLASQLGCPSPLPAASTNGRRPPRRQQTLAEGNAPSLTSQSSLKQHPRQNSSSQLEMATRIFEMLANLVLERPAFLLKLGSAVNIKWLLVFFGSNSEPRAASLALDIMTALVVKDKRYADRLARSGGIKILERLLPRFWNYPRILSRCWSTLFDIDEQPGDSSLYNQFKPRDQSRIICPLMMRLIIACIGAGFQTLNAIKPKQNILRSRPSETLDTPVKSNKRLSIQRSHSMKADATDMMNAFQISSELTLVKDNVTLIEEYAQKSVDFCNLLFSTPLLRGAVAVMTPYLQVQEIGKDIDSQTEISKLANRLLDVWANSAVESITTSASTQIVTSIVEAIPPDSDLSTATNFRLALFDRIACAVENIILPGLGDVLDDQVRTAISDFVEQCSGEVQNNRSLHLTAKVLRSFSTSRPSTSIIAALLTSLDRIILFRLAAGYLKTYHEIIQYQDIIFMDANQDIDFFRCLLYNVISVIQGKADVTNSEESEEICFACYNVLILLARARPALVESIIVPEKTLKDLGEASDVDKASLVLMGGEQDPVPFHDEWQGFTKSRDSLKAALHLDRMSRVTQSLLSSDEKQRAINSTETKMMAWQNSVRVNEENRLIKVKLDVKEMIQFGACEWAKTLAELQRERGILGEEMEEDRIFELDPTEGPMRMRPRLKEVPREKHYQIRPTTLGESRDENVMPVSHGDEWASADASLELDVEAVSGIPAAEKKVESNSSREEGAVVDTHDDKYRRVIRSLEKGDTIEGVENSLRVMFIECRASLLIFGKKCLYIIDDYFQRPDGELCNLWEAPEEERDSIVMSTLDSDGKGRQSLIEQLEGNSQQTRKWIWTDVKFVALKTFLHRKTAIEIHFKDGQSCLLVLATAEKADNVFHNLASRNKGAAQAFASLNDSLREAGSSDGSGFSRLAGAVMGRGVGSITQRWIDRKISNFDYLMYLNTAAGRTYQDITQYPVMPWVLRDYTSEKLNLVDPSSYRDLSLPMGAQQEARRERFKERYKQLQELEDMDPEATKPFHYGTHYSTAATVSGYLIRLRPFDKVLKALQGGTFDLADRTFSSIGKAYSSASEGSLGDVRELIPEAYYLPEFLTNSNKFDFGQTQSGTRIDDVELPIWAKGDPRLFIKLHREALESDHVSLHLHSWIDLIFGFKQQGNAAIEATNCFHELSYQDAVDVQSLDSSTEQQAILKTIHMFGVCPSRLFTHPHPCRKPAEVQDKKRLSSRSKLMMTESIVPIRTMHASVHFIYANSNPQKAFASPKDYLILPYLGLSLSVGHLDGSVRFFVKENMNLVRNVVEQVMPDRITALVDASSSSDSTVNTESAEGRILVAAMDGTLTAWSVNGPRRDLTFLYACRGHVGIILCLEYCQAWNMAVSGSQDCTAIIWDSRGKYFKSLLHNEPVQAVCISQGNGLIATASGPIVRLWSINGDLICQVSTNTSEDVVSLAFMDQDDHDDNRQQDSLCTLYTGHRGKVIAWTCEPSLESTSLDEGAEHWQLHPRHVLEHHDRLEAATTPLITAIKSVEGAIITGDELGRLFLWTLPGKAVEVPYSLSSTCMKCQKKFGVFEKRINCIACGGLFCNSCTDILHQQQYGNSRCCDHCRSRLIPLLLS